MDFVIKQLLIGWVGIVVVMAMTYVLGRKIRNYGIVDIVWAAGFAILAIFFALTGEGNELRRSALAIVVCLWSGRLTFYLFGRLKAHHPVEDRRYSVLRENWGCQANWKMLVFFQLQGLAIILLAVIIVIPTSNNTAQPHLLEIIGLTVVVVSILGESQADRQLSRFKRDTGSGVVCEIGLWHYSRHPNYFFEWLVWVGLYIFSCASGAWWTIYCPLLMLFLLLRVTGIPPNEAQLLKTKGAAYERYRETTSCFFPFPRKTTPDD